MTLTMTTSDYELIGKYDVNVEDKTDVSKFIEHMRPFFVAEAESAMKKMEYKEYYLFSGYNTKAENLEAIIETFYQNGRYMPFEMYVKLCGKYDAKFDVYPGYEVMPKLDGVKAGKFSYDGLAYCFSSI